MKTKPLICSIALLFVLRLNLFPQVAAFRGERIAIIQQDIAKWDKNRDGKLTGRERDEFLKQKRKEASEAEAAARAERLKNKPAKQDLPAPPLSADDAQKPIAKGVPKNIEDAQR